MKRNRINRKTAILNFVLIAFFMGHAAVLAESRSVLEVGHFSVEKVTNMVPAYWEHFTFRDIKRHADYRLAEEDGKVVVKAEAYASASGLFRKISIDPREYPIIQWSWKIVNILKKGNVYADYRKAFKDELPMISGVAIMTDADNTGESATAYFGDILFSKE